MHLLMFTFRDTQSRVTHHSADFPFKLTHTGFTGVIRNNACQCFGC